MKHRIFILLIIAFSFFISCDFSTFHPYSAKDFGESGDRTICGIVTDVDTGLSIEEAKILIHFRDVTFGGYETLDLLTITFSDTEGFFLRTFYTDGAGSNEWYLLVCTKEEYKNDTIKFSDDNNHYFTIKLEKE